MSVVQVYLQTAHTAEPVFLDVIPEPRIREHSLRVATALDNLTGPATPIKRVTLTGAAPAALKFVLERIRSRRETHYLHIKVHDLPLVRVLAVYEACLVLQIQPDQTHIEGHIVGHIAHEKMSPEEMLAVARCSYNRRDEWRCWSVLVQQVAWGLTHAKYSEDEAGALFAAAKG